MRPRDLGAVLGYRRRRVARVGEPTGRPRPAVPIVLVAAPAYRSLATLSSTIIRSLVAAVHCAVREKAVMRACSNASFLAGSRDKEFFRILYQPAGVDEPDVVQLDEPQPDHDRFIDIGIVRGVTACVLPRVTPDDAGVIGNDAPRASDRVCR